MLFLAWEHKRLQEEHHEADTQAVGLVVAFALTGESALAGGMCFDRHCDVAHLAAYRQIVPIGSGVAMPKCLMLVLCSTARFKHDPHRDLGTVIISKHLQCR
jgi:hypothetical protein